MRKLTEKEIEELRNDLKLMDLYKKEKDVESLEKMVKKYDELFLVESELDRCILTEEDLYAVQGYLVEKHEYEAFEDMTAYNAYAVLSWVAFTTMEEI